MENVTIKIITRSSELPPMRAAKFFHSPELFKILEQSPGHTPFMAVAMGPDGCHRAHLLAVLRRRGSLLPPYLYTHGQAYGEGEYEDESQRDALFHLMLRALTQKFVRRLCLYIEFSDLSSKMFGYRHFRSEGYFPVHWMHVHNSLHSKTPEERILPRLHKKLKRAAEAGVEVRVAANQAERDAYYRLLRGFMRLKFHRFTPPKALIEHIGESDNGRIFVTTYHGKIIGGCVCVYSGKDAFLWYLASRRKSYAHLHPNAMTVWHAINDAHERHFDHINFMNVGLPFRKSPFREFILKFGGKPVGTYRWFRCSVGWVNKLLTWLYRE